MTEEIKEKFRQAKSLEEAKEIFESVKGELDDDDLAMISGGSGFVDFWERVGQGIAGVGEWTAGAFVELGALFGEEVELLSEKLMDDGAKRIRGEYK